MMQRNPDAPDSFPTWWVGRAALATPNFFKAVKSDLAGDESEYTDGGFVVNNPTEEAYDSVKQLNHNNPRTVQVLVSIGTGKPEVDLKASASSRIYETVTKPVVNSEVTHNAVTIATSTFASYFRLNVEHGIGRIKSDAWEGKNGIRTLELIRNKTEAYLESTEGKEKISDAAKLLVSVRRARASKDPVKVCIDKGKRWTQRQDLRRHLENRDRRFLGKAGNIESLLDAGKEFPLD